VTRSGRPGFRVFGGELVSEASLNQMLEMKEGYGKGIFPIPVQDIVGYGHNGQIDAFASILAYFPDEKVAVALVANGVDGSLDDICTGITRTYFNLPFEVPTFAPLPKPTLPGTLAFAKSVGEGNFDIYVIDTDGSGLRPVTATSDRWEQRPSWSPDGKRIVYSYFIPGDAVMDTETVQVANVDGSEQAQLGKGNNFFPAWSPDGRHIVFTGFISGESLPYSVRVMNPDGSGTKELIDTEMFAFPSWAPNGDILFLRDWDLYSMKPDGSATIRLTTGKDIGGYALSPDGKTLAYYDRGEKAILTMPLGAGGSSVRLLETAWLVQDASFVALSWSPDGKAIALASSGLNMAPGSPLYIVNADGSGLTQVPGVDAACDPSWRPQ
jgi:Tol biopolymer transport system component